MIADADNATSNAWADWVPRADSAGRMCWTPPNSAFRDHEHLRVTLLAWDDLGDFVSITCKPLTVGPPASWATSDAMRAAPKHS